MPWRNWIASLLGLAALVAAGSSRAAEPPKFQVDPMWGVPLPNNWALGQTGGIFVDAQDHIWLNHRPRTMTDREKRGSDPKAHVKCCVAAPPVIEFDQNGNVVQAWGGPGQGYEWQKNEHGIFVDHNNFVWVGGNDPQDGQVVKFTRDGKFVMQIGKAGPVTNSNDAAKLGRPADMIVDPATNELYVADGYGNHRVIVFDAATGAYKRHWGAYGKPPTDDKITYDPKASMPQQFGNPVHCIRMSKDGLVYVCDRYNNRIQVFRKDGTFVTEFPVLKDTLPSATTGSVVFWPDAAQTYVLVSDDPNAEFHLLNRADGKYITSFGHMGHGAGEFDNLHNLAIDSKGNIYAAEVAGKRVQKFRNVGGL